ncbi:MAG: hypothetical protein HY943_20465 [Gammaproteobacteria bacterium]|nr:hypothetical protein [Gammaproteobacteria bacterium]
MPRLTNVTRRREIPDGSSPAMGGFVLDEKKRLERLADDHSDARHDDELLDASSPAMRQLMRFTAESEAITTRRAIQIPIATTDFVRRLRRPTAVSCIVPYQTPAR